MANYKAGLDDSGAGLIFAVTGHTGNVILDEHLAAGPHISSTLPLLMEEQLKKHGLTFNDITEWSVGAGPGSFTGLRLASAFVMGLTFQRPGVRTRCVSTSAMIAGDCTAQKVLALFDGRKSELLAYGMESGSAGYREDGFNTVIRNEEEFNTVMAQYDAAVAYTRDHDAARNVLGTEFADANIRRVEKLSALALIRFEPENFERPLKDLLYLRPAVFVAPQKIRDLSADGTEA